MLHLGRVLGGGGDGDIAILTWQGDGNLAFQVEMFLPARAKFARCGKRRRSNRARRIALGDFLRRQQIGLCRQRIFD